jgi:predicted DNA-binding transcriptional regulator YafY
MGKAAMCIQMIQYLDSGRLYKISELADLLETNPRNIIEYKKELEEAGYYITSVPGKYGGYRLDMTKTIPAISLLPKEKESILNAYSYITARPDFPMKDDFVPAMAKVFSRLNLVDQRYQDTTVIDRYRLAMPEEEINERYVLLEKAILSRHVVNIDYLSNDNVVRNRNIQPYKLYMYNNAWFLIAYCEMAKDWRYFKLCRISKYERLDRRFSRDVFYNEHELLDSFGMTANTEDYRIKLRLTGAASMYVKDYIYGKNQTITECEDRSTILEVDLRYRKNCVSFVLGFRGECEILEPEWLKEEVREAATTILASLGEKRS